MEQYMQDQLSTDILNQAMKRYDVPKETMSFIGGFENFVYEFQKDNNAFVMRFVHSGHRTFHLVLAELEFIDYLANANASVSTVILSVNNRIAEKIDINDSDYFTVSVFTKARGKFVKKEDITPSFLKMFGTEVGKLHKLTKSFKPSHLRHHWYEEQYRDIGSRVLSENDSEILRKLDEVMSKIRSLPMTEDVYGLIHTDLHFHNMFYDQRNLIFFDFDDSSYKHFISDIAIIIYYMFVHQRRTMTTCEYNQKVKDIIQPFLTGYEKENNIPHDFFEHINEFLLLRSLILYIVLVAAGFNKSDDEGKRRICDHARERAYDESMLLDIDYVFGGSL